MEKTDSNTNIRELKEKINKFCEDRDWDKYHNVKDLAIGIITEASELLEHFRFKSEKEIEDMFKDAKKRKEICEEIADIMHFILRLAEKHNIDLTTEISEKMGKNEKKYPIEKAKGLNKKYNELSKTTYQK